MTSAPPPQQPDAERDAWLREALRHAPDADLAPPAALSQRILREAQLKLRRAAAEPPRSTWTRLWIWSARPAVGAGLASVMLAGVIAGMWWDRPMQENSPRATSEPPRAEAASPPGEERTAAAPAAPPAQLSQPAAPSPSPQAAAVDRAADAQAGAAAPAPAPRAAKSRPQAPQGAAPLRREALPGTEQPVSMPLPEAAPDALSKAARTAGTMAPAAPTGIGSTAPSFAAPPRAPLQTKAEATGQISAAAPAPRAAARQRASPPVAERSLSALRLAISADPQPWSWQRAQAPVQPVSDALAAWLAAVDQQAAGRWSPGALGAVDPAWRPLRLLHQGRVVHRLGLDGSLLRWESADAGANSGAAATVWQAPLDGAQVEALRGALERFAP
jgi:hypothetical protein